MQLIDYKEKFDRAIKTAIEYASQYVKESLPTSTIINVCMDPKTKKYEGYDNAELLAKKLFRNGNVPTWIDLNVATVRNEKTIITCHFSSEFTDDEERLMHKDEGNPPFHTLGPGFPHSDYDFSKDGKFSIKNRPDRD